MAEIHGELPIIFDRRCLAAEQLVRDQVLAETFRDLPATVGQKLAAAHYELSSSASPLVLGLRG